MDWEREKARLEADLKPVRSRRRRRWERRLRIVAPLLFVPLMLATLALAVGIVEVIPAPAPDLNTPASATGSERASEPFPRGQATDPRPQAIFETPGIVSPSAPSGNAFSLPPHSYAQP